MVFFPRSQGGHAVTGSFCTVTNVYPILNIQFCISKAGSSTKRIVWMSCLDVLRYALTLIMLFATGV